VASADGIAADTRDAGAVDTLGYTAAH